MPRRPLARLVASFATITAGLVLTAPAAHADGNLTAVALPGAVLAGAPSASSFTFTTTGASPTATTSKATFAFSGITNLTPDDVTLTCDGNTATVVMGATNTFTCSISNSSNSHTGSLQIARGLIGSRVGAGRAGVVVTTTYGNVVQGNTTGTVTTGFDLQTPPSATQDITSIKADGQPHTVTVHLDNHSPAAGRLGRLDLKLTGPTGLSASNVHLSQTDGTAIPLSGSGPFTAELTTHNGFALADVSSFDFPYRMTVDGSLHGGTMTSDLTFDQVGSTGAVLSTFDEDNHPVTVVNKPTVFPNLPATLQIDDDSPSTTTHPATFTQQVGNKSGSNIAKAEVDYKVTVPAGTTAAQLVLSYLPTGSSTYTVLPWTVNGQVFTTQYMGANGFELDDMDTTIDTPFKLEEMPGAPSGLLSWNVDVVNQSDHTTILSDIAQPITVAQKRPGTVGMPTATGANKKLIVSFNPGDNGSVDPTTYTVTATPTAGGASVTGTGTSIPVTVTGLVNNTKYNLTVHAANKYGASPAESPTGTGTPLATPPAAPTIVRIDPYDGYAVATVANPVDDGGSVITSYRASYVRTDGSAGGSSVIEDASDSTITLPGLTNNVSYTVTVRAVNAIGAGSTSAPVTVIPNLPGGPTSPAGIRVSLGATAATVASGSSVVLSGSVVRNSEPQQGMTVAITFTGADKKSKELTTLTTDSLGAFSYKTKPAINGSWTASVTSVSPAVDSAKVPISVTAVLKSVKIVLKGRTLSATGYVTPGFSLSKVKAPQVQIQLVNVVTVSHVKVTRVVKTLVVKKALDNKRSGNPFSLSASVKPGRYLVRVATKSSTILSSGSSKPASLRVQ